MPHRNITLSMVLLAAATTASAQQSEAADSLTTELQEVVVTAGHPSTRLEGTTLVTTITGTPLQNLGSVLDES